jgi:capsular exopolysaccharide synthesis family protein
MVTVVCVTYLTTPVYQATTRVEIDPPGEIFALEGAGLGPGNAEYLETQAKILQGDSLALSVIRKLQLDQNSKLTGDGGPAEPSSALAAVSELPQLSQSEQIALDRFQRLLTVKRDTSSRLISVTFASQDPQLAALVPNTMVQLFVDQGFQTRHEAIMKSTEWLSRQLDDIRMKMEKSTQALTAFQASAGFADVDENKSTYTEHMGELSRQLTQAQAERIQLAALLKSVQSGDADSLPEVRNNPVAQDLSKQLAQHRAELSQALVLYGKNHPAAKRLQSQVDELEVQLASQKNAILNSLKASYAAARAREQLMLSEMRGTTQEIGQAARYSALKKEVQTNVDLYNSLYARIKEAGISAASKSAHIRVVDPARVPDKPARPRRLLNLSVGLLAALFGGVVLAFFCEQFDSRLRTPEDIKRWIGSSNVSIIPAIAGTNGHGRLARTKQIVGLLPPPAATDTETNKFLLERPDSPESEAMHALCASVMLSSPNDPPQVVLIASSFPGEGKTTVALNLAFALARHAETCLVDADLRKGRIAKVFGLPNDQGLTDVLNGSVALESMLHHVPGVNNLFVVPAGRANGNSLQLICSDTMHQVLHTLRQRVRYLVIDSAPILSFADGRALSTVADALVLVGKAGTTTRQAMQRSVELLSEVHGAPIVQVVLNGADLNFADYKYAGYGYVYRDAAAR